MTSSNGTFSALLAICAGIHRLPVNSPHKGQWRRVLILSLICAWINGLVNNPEAGYLWHHRAHYDVTVMWKKAIGMCCHIIYRMGCYGCHSLYQIQVQCVIRSFEITFLESFSWAHHDKSYYMMTSSNGTFSALLAINAGNSPVTGEFPSQRPVTQSFDVFFQLCLNKGWVNYREAVDLRRHRAHYDVITMNTCWPLASLCKM